MAFIKMTKQEFDMLVMQYLKGYVQDTVQFGEEDSDQWVEFIGLLKSKGLLSFFISLQTEMTGKDRINKSRFLSNLEQDPKNINILV